MTDPSAPEKHLPSAHTGLAASEWVRRWSHLVAAGSSVLDVACGSGRHTRWFHERGCAVTAIDRDAAALAGLQQIARTVRTVQADLEGQPWPLPGATYSAVVVTNYLWRALLPDIARSVGASGVLIYETFAAGNASVGKPSNPDFLLRPGELLHFAAAHGLRVVAYEDGFCSQPDRFIQRLVAVRPSTSSADMERHLLQPVNPPRAS
ncbi:MAG: class I SAM-dependent methyltransferase [Burkholderiaceae bacterium]|nr:class I SAM-dependent methyltransferase [Burkholderiaceae bacterium]